MTATRRFVIQRYLPDTAQSRWQTYEVQAPAGMTVLAGLQAIRENLDATLSWRHSCRMGVCGSCAMVIAGKPALACNTQLRDIAAREVRLQPLHNFPVVKDLVADLRPMFEKHRYLKPYVITPEHDVEPAHGYRQTPAQLDRFLQFSSCIKCGACMAACPTLASDRHFLGPMPLTAAHRYNSDSRDTGFARRREAMSDTHGFEHCHFAAECTRVCPKGVDPARAIQLMKRDLIRDLLRLRRPRPAEPVAGITGCDVERLRAPAFTIPGARSAGQTGVSESADIAAAAVCHTGLSASVEDASVSEHKLPEQIQAIVDRGHVVWAGEPPPIATHFSRPTIRVAGVRHVRVWGLQVDDERTLPGHERTSIPDEELWQVELEADDGSRYEINASFVRPAPD